MAFVGFIPWADVPAFVEAATPAAEAVAAAGEVAATASAAAPALILGAGLLGWEIGTQLRKTFTPDDTTPFPAPSKPFSGGQLNIRYRVTSEWQLTSVGIQSDVATLTGPIQGYAEGDYSPGSASSAHYWWLRFGPTAQAYGPRLVDDDIVVPPRITGLVPLDPLPKPDTDPPYAYPPGIFDPGVLNPTIAIPGMPGSPEFPGEIVPFRRPSGPDEAPETEPNQEEDPKVIVKIPGLGTQVTFEPTGVGLQGYNPGPDAEQQPQKDPRQNPPKAATTVCDCPCDVSEVLAKIKEVKDEEDDIKKLVTPKEYDSHIAVRLSGHGGSFTLQPLCRAVRVQVTVTPANASSYDGSGGPDIYLCGWHAFGAASVFGGERIPIQYLDNVYLCPDRAGTFTFGLKAGYSGIVTEYYDTEKTT
jgi:hypothetical protein